MKVCNQVAANSPYICHQKQIYDNIWDTANAMVAKRVCTQLKRHADARASAIAMKKERMMVAYAAPS